MRSDKRGFSLVELLIVMAVLGVITGTALLRTNFTGGDDDQEFQRILAYLRRQHARSLRTSEQFTVQFDTEEDRMITRNTEDEVVDSLPVESWSVEGTNEITVSAWYGRPGRLSIKNQSGRERLIGRDWIIGFVPERETTDSP